MGISAGHLYNLEKELGVDNKSDIIEKLLQQRDELRKAFRVLWQMEHCGEDGINGVAEYDHNEFRDLIAKYGQPPHG